MTKLRIIFSPNKNDANSIYSYFYFKYTTILIIIAFVIITLLL